jgi:hypothetical protein
MRRVLLSAALLGAVSVSVVDAATPVTVTASGAAGKLSLSRTAFASGTSFVVDQVRGLLGGCAPHTPASGWGGGYGGLAPLPHF